MKMLLKEKSQLDLINEKANQRSSDMMGKLKRVSIVEGIIEKNRKEGHENISLLKLKNFLEQEECQNLFSGASGIYKKSLVH